MFTILVCTPQAFINSKYTSIANSMYSPAPYFNRIVRVTKVEATTTITAEGGVVHTEKGHNKEI